MFKYQNSELHTTRLYVLLFSVHKNSVSFSSNVLIQQLDWIHRNKSFLQWALSLIFVPTKTLLPILKMITVYYCLYAVVLKYEPEIAHFLIFSSSIKVRDLLNHLCAQHVESRWENICNHSYSLEFATTWLHYWYFFLPYCSKSSTLFPYYVCMCTRQSLKSCWALEMR